LDAGGDIDNGDEKEEDFFRKRAQLDANLESKFEAIYEKYDRDFEEVGDEIDIETLEVVKSNGHLLNMRDETDVGGIGRSILDAFTQELEDGVESTSAEDTVDEDGSAIDVDGTEGDNIILRHGDNRIPREYEADILAYFGNHMGLQVVEYLS